MSPDNVAGFYPWLYYLTIERDGTLWRSIAVSSIYGAYYPVNVVLTLTLTLTLTLI